LTLRVSLQGQQRYAQLVNDVTFRYERPDYCPPVVLDDVHGATLLNIDAQTELGIDKIVQFRSDLFSDSGN